LPAFCWRSRLSRWSSNHRVGVLVGQRLDACFSRLPLVLKFSDGFRSLGCRPSPKATPGDGDFEASIPDPIRNCRCATSAGLLGQELGVYYPRPTSARDRYRDNALVIFAGRTLFGAVVFPTKQSAVLAKEGRYETA
jgi:hypothetical protein